RGGRVAPAVLARTLSEAIDFAAIASGLLGPALGRRGRTEHNRVVIQDTIAERAFAPVFQPIVRVEDGSVVGYEALTRFDDGTAPDARFIEAAGLGLGIDLELATLSAACEAQAELPGTAFVS